MRIDAPSLNASPHQAVAAWLLLWLEAVAAFLSPQGAGAANWLRSLERYLKALLFLRALEHFPRKPSRSSGVENAQNQKFRPFSDRKTAYTFSENGLAKFEPPPRLRQTQHPRGAPNGFRRIAPRGGALRLVTRNVLPKLHHASARERLGRFLRVLRDLDTFAARLAKRLVRGFIATRLIPVSPPAFALTSQAPSAIHAADTS